MHVGCDLSEKDRVRGGVLKKEVGSMLNKLIKLNKTR